MLSSLFRSWFLIIVTVAIGSHPASSSPDSAAPSLFTTATDAAQQLAEVDLRLRGSREYILSSHVTLLDSTALYWLPNPENRPLYVDNPSGDEKFYAGGRFRVTLEPGLTPTVQIERAEQHVDSVVTFVGGLSGVPDSFVTFSVSEKGFHGWVDTVVERYEISPLLTSAGQHASLATVRKLDHIAMQIDDSRGDTAAFLSKLSAPADEKKLPAHGPHSILTKSHGGTHVIGKWVLWTQATEFERNMPTFVSNLISTMNQSFSNSNANAYISLTHSNRVDYTESGSVTTDLSRLTDSTDGFMDGIPPGLDGWAADTAALIVDDDLVTSAPPWGAANAWINIIPEEIPYAVIADGFALGTYLFDHEVGHVFGGHHQSIPGHSMGFNRWADCEYAYESQSGTWMTIMGGCVSGGGDCTTRINYWSNADESVTYQGEQMGDDSDPEECSDISRVMFPQTLSAVLDWRSNPSSVPAAPTNLDVDPLQCYGQNIVSWADGGGGPTGEYRVYKSSSPSFSSQTLIYQAQEKILSVNVGASESPVYVRARACNLAGCSSYTVGDEPATYTNGCL